MIAIPILYYTTTSVKSISWEVEEWKYSKKTQFWHEICVNKHAIQISGI
jgi:hypothetical protein